MKVKQRLSIPQPGTTTCTFFISRHISHTIQCRPPQHSRHCPQPRHHSRSLSRHAPSPLHSLLILFSRYLCRLARIETNYNGNTDLSKNPYKTDGISKNALLRDGSHTAAAPVRTVRDPHFSIFSVFVPSVPVLLFIPFRFLRNPKYTNTYKNGRYFKKRTFERWFSHGRGSRSYCA